MTMSCIAFSCSLPYLFVESLLIIEANILFYRASKAALSFDLAFLGVFWALI